MEDKTKQKIQELVPEIMELKFGCRFKLKNVDNSKTYIYVSEKHENGCIFIQTSSGYNPEYRCIDKENLIGRPITLADVLLAIGKTGGRNGVISMETPNAKKFSIEEYFVDTMVSKLLTIWDLTKPYDNQSQETKDFIGSILGVK